MKILICNYASVFGGQEIFLKSFCDLLKANISECDISFVGSPEELHNRIKCKKFKNDEVYDIVLLNGISAARVHLFDLLKLRKTKFYYIHHSDLLDRQAGTLRVIPRLFAVFFICLFCQKVFFISERNKWFFSLFSWSALFPLNYFPCFSNNDKKLRYSARRFDKIKLLFVGSFTENKRWKTCVDISKYTGMPIKLFGDGRLAENNFDENVTFKGFCNDHFQIYRPGSVLLCLSRYEGLPLVVLEALKAGVPVICTDVGDIKRVLKHGRNGFIVQNHTQSFKIVDEVARYLILLQEDTELYDCMSMNAYESVNNVTAPKQDEFKQFLFGVQK